MMDQPFGLQSKRFHPPILGIADPFDQVLLQWLNQIQYHEFGSGKQYEFLVQIQSLQRLAFVR